MTTERKIYRTAILTPISPSQWHYLPSGACVVADGRFLAVGPEATILREYPNESVETLSGVMVPGFIDVHCHWVQHAVRGAYGGELLQWLQHYIWPEEGRFIDEDYARQLARRFYADMLRAGTVGGMSYSSVHQTATAIAVEEMRGDWIVGNVLMAVNAPSYLSDFSQHQRLAMQRVADTLPAAHYAVTPRFAPNMTRDDLRVAGDVARARDLPIQTHLAESRAELRWVKELFPEAPHYTAVYDEAGLLGPRSVLGHCIEMQAEEWRCLATRGAWVAHCPSSNEALDNGRMPLEQLREHRIPWALASDIGAGPSHSMLHVVQRCRDVHTAADVAVTAPEALYRATLAGAEAMGRGPWAGSIAVGKRADFVLLPDAPAPSAVEGWFWEMCQGRPEDLERRPMGTWLSGRAITQGDWA